MLSSPGRLTGSKIYSFVQILRTLLCSRVETLLHSALAYVCWTSLFLTILVLKAWTTLYQRDTILIIFYLLRKVVFLWTWFFPYILTNFVNWGVINFVFDCSFAIIFLVFNFIILNGKSSFGYGSLDQNCSTLVLYQILKQLLILKNNRYILFNFQIDNALSGFHIL